MPKHGGTADPDVQARLKHHQEFMERTAADDLAAVMATAAGRRFIAAVIYDRAHVLGASLDFQNPVHTAWNEGRRSLGQELLIATHRQNPALYVQMVHERLNQEKIDESVFAQAHSFIGEEDG